MLIEGCWQRKHNMATKHELIWGDYFLLETLLQLEGRLPPI
jgi:unsaturated chondroitin disaccharide hydrolase